jgi:hypothetical protein
VFAGHAPADRHWRGLPLGRAFRALQESPKRRADARHAKKAGPDHGGPDVPVASESVGSSPKGKPYRPDFGERRGGSGNRTTGNPPAR